MKLIRGLHNLKAQDRESVVTIGNFDGVHRGHLALLERQRALAAPGMQRVVQIFEPTPRERFEPQTAPPRIQTLRDKLCVLAEQGVDAVFCVRFSRAFAAMPAEDYVREVLVNRLRARAVVVGDDFRFGAGRGGDLALLQRLGAAYGFSAESVASIRDGGERVSSTAIRAALAEADLERARRMLGRWPRISGVVRRGLQLGRALGMPTANLSLRRKMALRHGVYAVFARVEDGPWRPAVANLGVRPTLGLHQQLLEIHVFDVSEDFYGRRMTVEFRHFLRPEQRFAGTDALRAQMHRDGEMARQWLSAAPMPSQAAAPT